MDSELIEKLEKETGCVNSEKLNYLADAIDLSCGRWYETPLAMPDDMASEKINNIAERFKNEPELTFAEAKKFRDIEVERLGIDGDVKTWFEKGANIPKKAQSLLRPKYVREQLIKMGSDICIPTK